MTRKQALAELIAKVEAGTLIPDNLIVSSEVSAMIDLAVNVSDLHGDVWADLCAAYDGSLDAAKALHEAVLKGWTMDQMNQWHEDGTPRGWAVHLLRHKPLPKKREQGSGFGITPARAWLLAILRALHAMEAAE